MKIFFRKISWFLLLILITCFTIEIMIRFIPNEYKLKRKYLDNGSNNVEILFLGASDAQAGLNPSYTIKRSFNAANPAQSLDCSFAILNKYENNWSGLEFIVLTVSYPTLFMKLEDSWEEWRIKNYNMYYKIQMSKKIKSNTEILNGRLFDHLIRIYNYYVKDIDEIQCTDLGWWISSTTEPQDSLCIHGIEAALGHTIPPEKQHFGEMKSALDSIIGLSKRIQCKVILCTLPAFKSYRENLDKIQLDSTINTLTRISIENNNCTYINLIDDEKFIDEDFFDGNHLNGNGAKKLTLMIDSILMSEVN